MLISILFTGGWLICIPIIFSFMYGAVSTVHNDKRIIRWLFLNFLVSLITFIMISYLTRGIGRDIIGTPDTFDVMASLVNSFIPSLLLMTITLPTMYIGVFVNKLATRKKNY